MDVEQLITKYVPCAATGAILAFAVFRFLGRKWIENKFAERLEDHKHKLENQREELKFEINSLLNRVTKIHQKEFEVLPEAWEKLDDLLDSLRQFIRETHEPPDLNSKSPADLEAFLTRQDLSEEAKANIRNAQDKAGRLFYEMSEKAGNACLDFQHYIAKNAIFLSSDIQRKFKEAERIAREAWAVRKTAEFSNERQEGITKACQITQKRIPAMQAEIEELVQKRLRFSEA